MEYGPNLLSNPSAETGDTTGWNTSGVTVLDGGVAGSKYFRLDSSAYMSQEVENIAFVLSPDHLRIALRFLFEAPLPRLETGVKAYVKVVLEYFDTITTHVFPLSTVFAESEVKPEGTWYTFDSQAPLRVDSVLLKATVMVVTDGMPAGVGIDAIELQNFISDLEAHELNPNPHQLPLAITVNQQGIKATKGEKVMFWLKDTGDAEFAGELKAATGTFVGALQAATGTFSGTYTGFLDAEQIITGTLQAIDMVGGTIRTADIGYGRIELTSNHLFRSYNSSNQLHGIFIDPIGTYESITRFFALGSEFFSISNNAGGTGAELSAPGFISLICSNTIHAVSSLLDCWGDLDVGGYASFSGGTNLSADGVTVAPHNHGIANGTQLALAGGGAVTWVSYPGDYHGHSIS